MENLLAYIFGKNGTNKFTLIVFHIESLLIFYRSKVYYLASYTICEIRLEFKVKQPELCHFLEGARVSSMVNILSEPPLHSNFNTFFPFVYSEKDGLETRLTLGFRFYVFL